MEGVTRRPKIVLIVGYKKAGKTTLIEKLIPELSRRGYRVGTIKHHHSTTPVQIDQPGTDSWRHRKAGAIEMALVTPGEIAMFLKTKEPFSLDRAVDHFAGLDIVLVEGFHQEAKPKIEIRSLDHHHLRCAGDKNLLAVVEKVLSVKAVPSFTPRSIKPLADLIVKKILNSRGG